MNIALACGVGDVPVYVVDVDVDKEKGVNGFESLKEFRDVLPLPQTLTQYTPRGGAHFFFTSDKPILNRNNFRPGIDMRSKGFYVILAPSTHPNGKAYRWFNWGAALAQFPDAMRPKEKARPWEATQTTPAPVQKPVQCSSGDAAMVASRASAYLATMEPAIQGQGGHNALLRAAGAMVVGYMLDDDTALSLLWNEYNPRCIPPWNRESPSDVKDFERKVREARKKPANPFGYLRDADDFSGTAADIETGAEIAQSLLASEAGKRDDEEDKPERPDVCRKQSWGESDLPDEVFFPPGFIGDFVRYSVEHAPYPHIGSAFGAGLATLALLAGRKFRTAGGVRPNLYVCALAESGSGKEFPKGVIDKLAVAAGFSDMVGNRFASGEGVEDALGVSPSFLFKVDEVDTLLRPIGSKGGDSLVENLTSMLLSVYGESGGVHICRAKAGQQEGDRKTVIAPNLVLFCTAIPGQFYDALSERVVTSGLLSRFLTFDIKRPRIGRDPVEKDVPPHLVETANRLVTFWPIGDGKRGDIATVKTPVPIVVPITDEAERLMREFRTQCDERATKAIGDGDSVMNAVVVRSYEKAYKLALLYAVSKDDEKPEIAADAARWAIRIERFCSGRLLEMFGRYGSASDFEKKCRRILTALENAKGHYMKRSDLLNSMRGVSAKELDELMRTLVEREKVSENPLPTKGRTGKVYSLTSQKTA